MLTMEHRTSVDQLDSRLWDTFAPRQSVALESAHLRACERARVSNVEPHYVIGYDGDRPVGIAHFFLIDLDLASLSSDIDPVTTKVLRAHNPSFLRLRTLECGFVAALGEAVAAASGYFEHFLQRLAMQLDEEAQACQAEIVLIRDVPIPRLDAYRPLLGLGYRALWGFPLVVMPIEWDTFDEYLGSLKSKTRYNLRKKRRKLIDPRITVEIATNFAEYAEEMVGLWSQTNQRAIGYQHEQLNAKYFQEISRELGDRSEALLIRKDGKLVGMAVCMRGDAEYCILHGGHDYDYEEGGIYHNLTLLGLERAIQGSFRRFNMGITAYDTKFEIGGQAEPMAYFVKHATSPELTASLARLLGKSIKQPRNLHQPRGGTQILRESQTPKLRNLLSQYQYEPPESDIFRKAFFYDRINEARSAKLYAFFPVFEGIQGPIIERDGRSVIMLGSNSYLGLASHPRVQAAAKAAIDQYGTGCSGSPVLNGTLDIHVSLARELAEFLGKDEAILFSTGYQANLGVVSALAREKDIVLMDELDHASLFDGAILSRSRIIRYRHNDLEMLEELLARYKDRPKLIVADSVFSMEGTIARIPEIVQLARQYGARLMLDEAHAIGVLGPNGRGAAEHFGLLDEIDLVMGTFSKSFASIGGFIAGDAWVIDFLKHNTRSHLFSASLPPAAVAAARAALAVFRAEPEARSRLLTNAQKWSAGLRELGYHAPYCGTPIVPVHCGNDTLAYGMFQQLLRNGVFVNPVLPPAVPQGRQLLRTSVMATHDWPTLQQALNAFAQARTEDYPARFQP